MKSTFIGLHELNKFGSVSNTIKVLKKYEFTTVYLSTSILSDAIFFKNAGFKVLVWLSFNKSIDELVSVLKKCFKTVNGACFDYIRYDKTSVFNILFSLRIYYKLKTVIEKVNVSSNEYHCCLKCEDYRSVLSNEVQRLSYGQCIWLLKKCCKYCMLMCYHDAYGVPMSGVINLMDGLRKLHGSSVIPIFQTYKDGSESVDGVTDYNKLWVSVMFWSKYFKDKSYFRLGCASLDSFK